MPITFSQSGVLLTRSDVDSWVARRLAIDLKVAELREESALLERKLDAAKLFMDVTVTEVESKQNLEANQRIEETQRRIETYVGPPMTEVVLGLFSRSDRFTAGDVVELVKMVDGVGGTKRANANNVYTALRRLVDRAQLARQDDGSYTLLQEAKEPLSGVIPTSGSGANEGHHPSLLFNPQPAQAE